MNRPFSSKLTTKPTPATAQTPVPAPPTAKIDRRKKKKKDEEQQSRRNPLQNLNGSVAAKCNSSDASSVSVEAPRGCLRFFLSHSSSSSSSSSSKTPAAQRPRAPSKTPKSTPILLLRPSEPSKSKENLEKPLSRKARVSKKSPSCLNQWHSGKKPVSRTWQKSKLSSVLNSNANSSSKLECGSVVKSMVRTVGNASEITELKSCCIDERFTPLTKFSSGLHSDCAAENALEENSNKSNSKTPPVQASVSPEMQCGSSMVSTTTTPACYGAGHVVSGITDKRKCRPRGILAVGENNTGFLKGKALCNFDDDYVVHNNVEGVITSSDASMVPLPTEASMRWLLSPCNEDDEDRKENFENGSCGFQSPHSPFSPSSGQRCSSDELNSTSVTKCIRMSSSSLISPIGLPLSEETSEPVSGHFPVLSFPLSTPGSKDHVTLKGGGKDHYDLDGESSPFSMDSLGSGNVVCTPESDSSYGRAGLLWLTSGNHKAYQLASELTSTTEALHVASTSASVKDQTDLSFQFDSLTTSCNSFVLTQFQQVFHDQGSGNSSSTLENESQSQMRISWREGLMSQIYEMDEFDCCRCLSDDEEDDANRCSNDQLESRQSSDVKENNQILTKDSWSAKALDNEPEVGVDGKGKENFSPGPPQLSCSCAESISIDGGSLLASVDSDWIQCYKNELFQV
ncbi:hypothetical protein FEM48_Zijuj01G0331800 [Ziziphus jujuba var. spinosa]|uniref:Uncharacterized protein n=1 Tax=Ziziphus jujuba var. spinosa TaxID=714518 RepID=A0A978W6R1_ZIZJJ|nr:hypothetical protein FEM48_Zijuj01G0331800 [Ziziphus jujuba var. spinosa]